MIIVGIDEVGRGCWAGPMVAAAVVLGEPIEGLADSKKLTETKRKQLAKEIYLKAKAVGLGWVDAKRIDQIGLSAANREAMELALVQIQLDYDQVILDGSYNFLAHLAKTEAIVKADDSVQAVAAASIIAKVARDKYMADMAVEYPHYGFDKHVGYGTKLHSDMLALHGVCELHRLSYKPIQKLLRVSND